MVLLAPPIGGLLQFLRSSGHRTECPSFRALGHRCSVLRGPCAIGVCRCEGRGEGAGGAGARAGGVSPLCRLQRCFFFNSCLPGKGVGGRMGADPSPRDPQKDNNNKQTNDKNNNKYALARFPAAPPGADLSGGRGVSTSAVSAHRLPPHSRMPSGTTWRPS